MQHIAIRIEDDDEMENEEYVGETVQRIRRRSLVKVVGGCLLFGSGIVVGAASNMMIINDASNRELKMGFIGRQIAKRGGAGVVKKMIGEKAAVFGVRKVGTIAGEKGAGLAGVKGADYHYDHPDETPAPEYYPMGLGDKVYIPPVPKGQELDPNTPTGVGLFVPPE